MLPLVVSTVTLGTVMAGSTGFPPAMVDQLRTAKHIYVSTRRADGSESRIVPVWFMYDGSAILFSTGPSSHKVRRIRHGSPLYVRVGDASEPRVVGHAELIDDPAVAERMAPVYRQKYWIAWLGFFVPDPERVRTGKTLLVRVTPES